MKTTLKRISLLLALAIVTPALLFSIFELNSFSESERQLEIAYKEQLNYILFSVNQYCLDILTNWKNELTALTKHGSEYKISEEAWRKSFAPNSPLKGFVLYDIGSHTANTVYMDKSLAPYAARIPKLIIDSNPNFEPLIDLFKRHFNKIESFEMPELDSCAGSWVLRFIMEDFSGKMMAGMIVIDRKDFIYNIIGRRAGAMGNGKFSFRVLDPSNKRILGTVIGDNGADEMVHQLWVLPQYKIGIRPVDNTVRELMQRRSKILIGMIVVLNLLILTGVFFVFRNIKKEIQLAQIKSDFVSNVSHELRTPLSLIGMFAETLEAGRVRTEEKKKEYYSIISQETQRLSRIVSKILNFSQIEAGKKKFMFKETDLNSVVLEIFSGYNFHLKQKGFESSLDLMDELPSCSIDKEAMVEAILNLVDNAVKYSRDVKEITVSTGVDKSYVVISVADKGIGIGELDKKRIFEKFFRVSEGDVHTVKGTGLGLSIVHHIVSAHSGRIEVDSAPGKGSTFKIYLPAVRNT